MFRIVLEKENFKFSCSHFTIQSPKLAERLHGHNYYVRVELEIERLDPTLGMAFDFNAVKPVVRDILEKYDEMVLLPERSPFLRIERKDGQIRASFAGKTYELPGEDVRLLPLVNITAEELSREIATELVSKLRSVPGVAASEMESVTITVEETRGQSVAYRQTL